jgi:hypothetical protein
MASMAARGVATWCWQSCTMLETRVQLAPGVCWY